MPYKNIKDPRRAEGYRRRAREYLARQKAIDPKSFLKRRSEKQMEYYKRNKGRINIRRRAKGAGVTQEVFSELLGVQMGLCKICKVPMSMTSRRKDSCHVDHNHKTGLIRGLLCSMCNVAIGSAKDSPIVLREMANYVENNG